MKSIFRTVSFLLAAVVLSSCWGGNSWHRKLTVTVSTPNGDVQGVAVQRESIHDKSGWWVTPEASGAELTLGGEAVVVEFMPGKYLFALLGTKPATFEVLLPSEAPLKVADQLSVKRDRKVLPVSQYPVLVTFSDAAEPRSVKLVDPQKTEDALGAGYAIKSITLEITDEPTSFGKASSTLHWLDDVASLDLFWKTLIANGFVSNGSTEVRTFFILRE